MKYLFVIPVLPFLLAGMVFELATTGFQAGRKAYTDIAELIFND